MSSYPRAPPSSQPSPPIGLGFLRPAFIWSRLAPKRHEPPLCAARRDSFAFPPAPSSGPSSPAPAKFDYFFNNFYTSWIWILTLGLSHESLDANDFATTGHFGALSMRYKRGQMLPRTKSKTSLWILISLPTIKLLFSMDSHVYICIFNSYDNLYLFIYTWLDSVTWDKVKMYVCQLVLTQC